MNKVGICRPDLFIRIRGERMTITGLFIGFLVGIILQRGQFCIFGQLGYIVRTRSAKVSDFPVFYKRSILFLDIILLHIIYLFVL